MDCQYQECTNGMRQLNPVRLAYMIMEKAQERAIYNMWYTISTKERQTFVERVIRMERKLFDIEFPTSGSLYYKHSLGSGVHSVPLQLSLTMPQAGQTCIGPSSKLLWWYRGQEKL